MAEELGTFFTKLRKFEVVKDQSIELELKFTIDGRKDYPVTVKTKNVEEIIEIIKNLLKKYSKYESQIEQTINFIDDKNRIAQVLFIKGQQQSTKTYYSKESIIKSIFLVHNYYPAYKLSVSYETKILEFPIKDAKIARIKFRYSIILDKFRIDITLVKNVDNPTTNFSTLKEYKDKLLTAIDIKDFADKAPFNFADIIEFELEYIGDIHNITMKDLLIADTIFDFTQDAEIIGGNPDADYQKLIYEIAKIIKPTSAFKFKSEYGMKQLSKGVVELNKNTYIREVSDHITDYYITDKVDGKRTIIYSNKFKSDGKNIAYCISDVIDEIEIDIDCKFILDSEEYQGNYYIFDVLYLNGNYIFNMPFNQRKTYFEEVVKYSDKFKLKPFEKLTKDYRSQITNFKSRSKEYEVDGIILTPESPTYNNMTVYKYKPIERMSVDFLIKKCPTRLLGISPFNVVQDKTLYLLFCGISKKVYHRLNLKLIKHYNDIFLGIDPEHLPDYFPIQFCPSNNNYAYLYYHNSDDIDSQIGEFIYVNDKWQLDKIRADRAIEVKRGNYFGNNYKVCESIWMAYDNPLVIEQSDNNLNMYFKDQDNILQKASRSFNSYVKSKIFSEFSNTNWVIDIASGKGQDLFRYSTYKMRNVLFLEIDNDAIDDLIERKHVFANSNEFLNPMQILVHQMNMLHKTDTNIAKLQYLPVSKDSVNLIICNFAFHYFLADKKSLTNVVKFIDYYLKTGGHFVFTAFDGKSIIRLLNDNEGEWTHKVKDKIQYSIKKQYKVNFIEPIGQIIEVMLPFSSSEYYKEYLVNIDYITEIFEKYGFYLETNKSFGEYLQEYMQLNKHNSLTKEDIKYVSLYHQYSFTKKGKKK